MPPEQLTPNPQNISPYMSAHIPDTDAGLNHIPLFLS